MKLILLITKGIIRDQRVRRWAMFAIILAALVMLFAGWTFLASWLEDRPVLLLGYWAVCTWLTLVAILLALYDMLALRIAAREERRRLRRKIFGDVEDPPDKEH